MRDWRVFLFKLYPEIVEDDLEPAQPDALGHNASSFRRCPSPGPQSGQRIRIVEIAVDACGATEFEFSET